MIENRDSHILSYPIHLSSPCWILSIEKFVPVSTDLKLVHLYSVWSPIKTQAYPYLHASPVSQTPPSPSCGVQVVSVAQYDPTGHQIWPLSPPSSAGHSAFTALVVTQVFEAQDTSASFPKQCLVSTQKSPGARVAGSISGLLSMQIPTSA